MRRSIFLFLATLVLAFSPACRPADARSMKWGEGYMPNLPVVDQDGTPLMFYDDLIKGKIVVISFIYTTCRDICPLVTARLEQVRQQIGDAAGRNIHFVSISIDPENDTPEALKEHATAFSAGPGWRFLTGTKKNIDAIRYKLGERSQMPSQHRNEILLGNDLTGEWARDSAFADLGVLATNILAMDPAWRATMSKQYLQSLAVKNGVASAPQPGQALFIKLCVSCHTVGKGDRVGPDLNGVFLRRERPWIERYIAQPDQVRAAHDPIATELGTKYRSVRMPNLGLAPADVGDLMAYLVANTTKPPAAHSHSTHAHKH
jgi:protein SCO1